MKKEMGPVVAWRKYFRAGDVSKAAVVEVEIAAPAKSPHSKDEFMCSFRVKSPTSDQTETVYGIDPLQALLLALGYVLAILQRLDKSLGLSLSSAGGDAEEFGIRIPKFSEEEPPTSPEKK